MKHIALIPAYQPDKELIQVISGLAERNFTVITVDDGSGQEYESIFRLASNRLCSRMKSIRARAKPSKPECAIL